MSECTQQDGGKCWTISIRIPKNPRLAAIASCGVLGCCLLSIVAWSPPDKVVETEALRIVDKAGKPRATLGVAADGSVSLDLLGADQAPRVRLWTESEKEMGLTLQAGPGSRRVWLRANQAGECSLCFAHESFTAAQDSLPKLAIRSAPDGECSFVMRAPGTDQAAEFNMTAKGGMRIRLIRGQVATVEIASEPSAKPELIFRDDAGQIVK